MRADRVLPGQEYWTNGAIMLSSEIDPVVVHKSERNDVLVALNVAPPPLFLRRQERDRLASEFPDFCGLYLDFDDSLCRLDIDGRESEATTKLIEGFGDAAAWNAIRTVPHQQSVPLFLRRTQPGKTHNQALDLLTRFLRAVATRRSSSLQFQNNADHYFFYRKVHEHVPGTMLIEAQRQAVYQHFYASTALKLGDVTISLNRLDSHFFDYANLMYPVEIVVDDMANESSLRPRRFFYRASFYQKQRLLSVIDTYGTAIELKQFDALRSLFIHNNDWFRPLNAATIVCRVVLASSDPLEAELARVSKSGVVLKITAGSHALDGGPSRAVIEIADRSRNLVALTARRVGVSEGLAEWVFDELGRDAVVTLSKIITRGFVSCSAGLPGEMVQEDRDPSLPVPSINSERK